MAPSGFGPYHGMSLRGRDATSTMVTAMEGATAMEGVTALEGATAMDGTTVTAMAMVEWTTWRDGDRRHNVNSTARDGMTAH